MGFTWPQRRCMAETGTGQRIWNRIGPHTVGGGPVWV